MDRHTSEKTTTTGRETGDASTCRRMTSPGVMTEKGHDRKGEWKECEWVLMRSIGVKQEKGRSPPFLCVEKKEQQRLEIHYDNNKRSSRTHICLHFTERSPQFTSCKKSVDTRRDKNKNVPDPAAKPHQEPAGAKGEEKMEFPGPGIHSLPDGFVADLRILPIPDSPTRANTWPRCPGDDRRRLLIKISPIILNREHSPTPPRNLVPAKRSRIPRALYASGAPNSEYPLYTVQCSEVTIYIYIYYIRPSLLLCRVTPTAAVLCERSECIIFSEVG